MLKHVAHYHQLALAAIPSVVALTLLVSSTPIQAAPAVPTDAFLCAPTAVGSFATRVHVRCATGAPPNASVFYFAVCTTPDSASASRFLSVFTTAKATVKNLVIFYTAGDTSGTACGCSAADCRVIWGAEVQQ